MTTNDDGMRAGLAPPSQDRRKAGDLGFSAYDAEHLAATFDTFADFQLRSAAKAARACGALKHGRIADASAAKFTEHVEAWTTFDDLAQRARRVRDERVEGARVVDEPRVYGKHSPNSYYLDLARSAFPGTNEAGAAQARLDRHAREIAVEFKAKTAEGRRFDGAARTLVRSQGGAQREHRVMTSQLSSGGSFVTPQYLTAEYALFRAFEPAFVDQCRAVPDDGFGLTMYVPTIESDLTVAAQLTEGSGVADAVASGGYLSANLVTYAGEVPVSQQLLDRSVPPGFDSVLHSQLAADLDATVDAAALTAALAGAGSVTRATFSVLGLWSDVGHVRSQMETTAGTKIMPTHVFGTPTMVEWLRSQVDATTNRPVFEPSPSNAALPIVDGPDGRPPSGFTGDRLLSLGMFEDGSIPASGANTQIVVAAPREVFVMRSEPAVRVFPETLANELSAVVQLYQYVAVLVRFPKAIQSISGNAYPSAVVWA